MSTFQIFNERVPRKFTKDSDPLYFAPFEVVIHNKPDDCWVSFLGKVYDITPLMLEFEGQECLKPLTAHAGKDISSWFDAETNDIQHRINPITGIKEPYLPFGKIPHTNNTIPNTGWRPIHLPWWKDDKKYFKGFLTKNVRLLKIVNTIILGYYREVQINVCCEDTFYRIMERYSVFNSDPDSYSWKYLGKPLSMSKTMEENGIIDDRERLAELGLPPNLYIPTVFLYYLMDIKYDTDFDTCQDECRCAT